MCNTSLASTRVYRGCISNELSVVKRIDVIPKEGMISLFSVFIIIANEWLSCSKTIELFPRVSLDQNLPSEPFSDRVTHSLFGEEIESICVRTADANHTTEYSRLLHGLGKPSSDDKEKYIITENIYN